MLDIRSILVPVDFAECSKRGFELALALAVKYEARIELLHVWLTPAYVAPSMAVAIGNRLEPLEELARREANGQIEDFLGRIENARGVPVDIQIIYGVTHEVILERAKKHDLVVMGTHGRRGVSHVFLGSVTEKVIRDCPRPVMVVRGPEPKR